MRSAAFLMLCLAMLAGCDTSAPKSNPAPAPAYVPETAPAGETTPAADSSAAAPAEGAPSAEAAPAPDMEREKAVGGVGKQGQGYGGGIITEPIHAYFTTRQTIELEVKLPQAMSFFKAETGRLPKSQEEFDTKIIQANAIALPELPEGHRYVYDPATGDLMVEHPK